MVKTIELQKELSNLSKTIENQYVVEAIADIVPEIELSANIELPFRFRARVFAPGSFLGFNFRAEDIKRNMHTIFNESDNIANYELNIDHKNNRKHDSSVFDLIGRVVDTYYDDVEDALFMDCQVTNRIIAESIAHGSLKYVSIRIMPTVIDYIDGEKYAVDFNLEELSIVRAPQYKGGKIINNTIN